jgi:O-methyltransferase
MNPQMNKIRGTFPNSNYVILVIVGFGLLSIIFLSLKSNKTLHSNSIFNVESAEIDVISQLMLGTRDLGMTKEQMFDFVKDFTMVPEYGLDKHYQDLTTIFKSKRKGSIVEFGLWKGGVLTLTLLLCQKYNCSNPIYAFDTFDGLPKPTEEDDESSVINWNKINKGEQTPFSSHIENGKWCLGKVSDVIYNVVSSGVPLWNLHLIKGRVKDTLLTTYFEESIVYARLDTDWYSSPKIELEKVFENCLVFDVVLDGYDVWGGTRKATDEFLTAHQSLHGKHVGGKFTIEIR